eukprot:COSAG05_NODE_657_length_8056_cov_5.853211_5_plen_305_part_00
MPPRGGRGSGRGGKRGGKRAPALGARRVVVKRERERSSDRQLEMRMQFARVETGHPAPSFHGLTTEQSEADDEATALRARLQSLGGEIPGGRWASDIKHLKKKFAALGGGGGDDNNSDDNSGDEYAAPPTNQDIQRIDEDLSGGSLSYEERMLAIEERALRQDVCETSGYRRRLGQQVNQAQQRSIQAQNTFKILKVQSISVRNERIIFVGSFCALFVLRLVPFALTLTIYPRLKRRFSSSIITALFSKSRQRQKTHLLLYSKSRMRLRKAQKISFFKHGNCSGSGALSTIAVSLVRLCQRGLV